MAQALWYILGFAQRNAMPDTKGKRKPAEQKRSGSIDDFMQAFPPSQIINR